MLLFFFIPIVIRIVHSFLHGENFQVSGPITTEKLRRERLWPDVNRTMAINSLIIGAVTATTHRAVGLPVAYWLHVSAGRRLNPACLHRRGIDVRWLSRSIYAWRSILGTNGVINSSLTSAGIVDEPLGFLIFKSTLRRNCRTPTFCLRLFAIILYTAIRPVSVDLLWAAVKILERASIRWRRCGAVDGRN
ncbi:MAG: hypothetical protein R2706_13930 [Acidimicrobiales bacterium]